MDEAHQQMLQRLAAAGRLGDFCPWPKPVAIPAERCVIHPQLVVEVDGERKVLAPWKAAQIRDGLAAEGYVPEHE